MTSPGFIVYGPTPASDCAALTAARETSLRVDERRRIARELHDTTSQSLVAFQLHLGRLKHLHMPETASIIGECEEAIREIREHIRAFDVSD
jgi:signal transduction histidine kinase